MATLTESFADLETTRGKMRVHLFIPDGGKRYPAVIFYSEIFQATGPIRRTAAALAGEGYLVAVPEVYHEFEPLGTVLAYDTEGTARGNELKITKEISSYDEDTDVAVAFLREHESCTGRIASFGVCLGGHLAVRAGLRPHVSAVGAFYPTDIHTGTLGLGKCDDTLARLPGMEASLLILFGRQDPHVPLEGRRLIRQTLEDGGVDFEWHEFNAAHAFLRDEGVRYNPALARVTMSLLLRFLAEKIG
ncbi:dienelactone hydrolase family protein [Luteolibacter yonseiensis]|uniref:Dienelactone hydrolase family protein n=1 Tax=Luteolibacter yonseiensis TaxID=1144680 RepID=A0A934R3Q5_9BACT|nr:dienelactone hydrolase family protein [Luteolibacter yonseiensis]MBK1814735.1 dienelactone hydrolase family protein [Luteolibacter yonseiensis]